MINHDAFKGVWNKNPFFRITIKKKIDEIIPTINYGDTGLYRYEEFNGRYGVVFCYFGRKIWSWINSINTNYTSIYHILEFINDKEGLNLTDLKFTSANINNTTELICNSIEKHKETIFKIKSEVFKKMFFATQLTWSRGNISTIVCLHRISKNFDIKCDLNYDRGNSDDMTKGVDYKMFYSGATRSVQHKSCDLNDCGTHYTSRSLLYNEQIYRKNVDLLSIQSGDTISLFLNSNDKNLIGNINKEFFVYKTLRVDKMILDSDSKKLERLLTDLNRLSYENRYIFMFERDDSDINRIIIEELSGVKTIRLFLNNINDKNLIPMLEQKLEELKNLSK